VTVSHLCHVLPSFAPGGAQIRTVLVMNGLGQSYRHTVVAIDDDWHCRTKLMPELDVDFVPAERGHWGKLYPLYMGRKLRSLRPDLVLTYNWGAMDAVVGAMLRRVRPWVQIMDGFEAAEARQQIPRRVRLRRLFYRRAQAVVVVSRGLENIAREQWGIPADRVQHIPNGIDLGRFSPGDGSEMRARLGLGSGDLLVGSVAHVRGEKNPIHLLEGFARCAQRFPEAHLVYVGATPGRRSDACAADRDAWNLLQAGIERHDLHARVHFAGKVNDVVPAFRALDVFALSSHTEQMPLSVLEAMACAKPVVSTDVGDVKWMVSEANASAVVPVDDSEAYARALGLLLGDASLRDDLGACNRARAESEFGLQGMIEAYGDLFARLC